MKRAGSHILRVNQSEVVHDSLLHRVYLQNRPLPPVASPPGSSIPSSWKQAMHAQVGELKVDEADLALRGVLVRHLVMPRLLEDTREIMRWIAADSTVT